MLAESSVRAYSRSFPGTFESASGSYIYDAEGRRFLDFLSGCGSLNYGHNHPILKEELLSYIGANGISMSLDLWTQSKEQFLDALDRHILEPRGLEYRAQFTGPTGTNAVEAAIKLARAVTGRSGVVSFTNAFHGCTLGSLALTGNTHHRQNSSGLLTHVTRAAYDGYFGDALDTSAMIGQMLQDPSSGVDKPAAFIVETIQGEGGLNAASAEWLRAIASIAREHGSLLIIDDIQAGCGRSGNFFSFEQAGVIPDIVVLAKSLSGYGLPLSLVLLRPGLDVWMPGEHNGTFRGNNLAFVTGAAALEFFWGDNRLVEDIRRKEAIARNALKRLLDQHHVQLCGKGLMLGLKFDDARQAVELRDACYEHGLIIETCGPKDEVLKFLPPLNIAEVDLLDGIEIVSDQLARGRAHPASEAMAAGG